MEEVGALLRVVGRPAIAKGGNLTTALGADLPDQQPPDIDIPKIRGHVCGICDVSAGV